MNERDAVDRLKRGDISGLEALVRMHQTRSLRVAYLITRDAHLAEDVVQSTFLRLYEKRALFDPERPFGPWLMRSVTNAAVKASTRARRNVSFDDRAWESLLDAGQPESMLHRADTVREVREALAELSPAQRAAIVMRYYLDLSEAEMALRLDVPRGTVKRRLHDARERLRGLLRRDALDHRRTWQ